MARFIELFVRRPVLAIVVSLVILMLGLRSMQTLNVRQYPESSTAVVTITTPYPGANAELVRGFVTAPLEQAIASAHGIDFLDSSSAQGVSTIRAHLELNYDPNAAVAQILTKINQVRNQLPPDSENPIVTVSGGEFEASMYLAFASEVLAPHQVTDYLVRAVRPQLESIDGVQQAQIIGAQEIAMRIWLDPQRLTAYHLTATDVREALAANNFLSAVGNTRGATLSINLEVNTALHSVEDFERLVVREEGNAVIRLRDVATVALGAVSYETSVYFNGTPAVFMAIEVVPTENVLDVIGRVRVELVIGSTADPLVVFEAAQALLAGARQSGQFLYIDTDLKFDQLQIAIDIDRAKAADLGIDMATLGRNLSTLLSAGYVNFFSAAGRSYRVIPQVDRQFRLTPEQLTQYHVRTESGALVPLSTIVRLRDTVQPRQLVRFNQLNAATISGVPAPGVTLGTAVAALERLAAETLPNGFVTNWAGQSRQFFAERTTLVTGFLLAVILMYLVLAAQFESFRDPAIMLVSVPISLAGALLFMALGVVTLNIYTQIGLLALVASIIRHGILLVEFANQVQRRDALDRRHAVEIAAAQRLRPILMTTIATLFGTVPLWFAGGPGAESRFAIGFVLGAGMAIGTAFTLFVVPALYTVIAKEHHERLPADTTAATSTAYRK